MLAILNATTVHYIQKQDAALRRVDSIFKRGREQTKGWN